MIGVLVVDDHPVLRSGLAQLLEQAEGIELVGLAADGAEGIELALSTRPDVVLMDLQMPGLDGVEATRRILSSCAGTRVVVLTSFSDRERILDALDAGATGYLLKDADAGRAASRNPRGRGRRGAAGARRRRRELLAERRDVAPGHRARRRASARCW